MPDPNSKHSTETTFDPPWLRWAMTGAIALATVYFVADDSGRVRELEAEVERLKSTTTQNRAARSAFPKPGATAALAKTWTTNNGAALPQDEFLARIGITPKELKETDEITARGEKGEYILKMERPLTRRFLDYDFRQLVAENTTRVSERYDPVFTRLGISDEKAEQLKTHLGKIQRASLELSLAQQQDDEARQAYDKAMRSALSEEDYANYREFESARHVTHELDRIRSFAQENGFREIDVTQQERLIEVLRKHSAYAAPIAEGPYDPKPPSIIGTENVLRELQNQRKSIEDQFSRVQQNLTEAEFGSELLTLIQRYQEREISKRDQVLERIRSRHAAKAISSNPDVLHPH